MATNAEERAVVRAFVKVQEARERGRTLAGFFLEADNRNDAQARSAMFNQVIAQVRDERRALRNLDDALAALRVQEPTLP